MLINNLLYGKNVDMDNDTKIVCYFSDCIIAVRNKISDRIHYIIYPSVNHGEWALTENINEATKFSLDAFHEVMKMIVYNADDIECWAIPLGISIHVKPKDYEYEYEDGVTYC